MELHHPDGWRITSVRISRDGPAREYLRLTLRAEPGRTSWMGDYISVEQLAAVLARRGLDLTDFSEADQM